MFNYKQQPWRVSSIMKRPDNIMASEYTYDHMAQIFTDKREVNMFDLLSMEYAKIWHRKAEEARLLYVLRPNDNDFLTRRFVIRGLLISRIKDVPKPIFRMRKFENVPPRIDTNIRKFQIKALTKEMSEEEKNKIFEEARNALVRKKKEKK